NAPEPERTRGISRRFAFDVPKPSTEAAVPPSRFYGMCRVARLPESLDLALRLNARESNRSNRNRQREQGALGAGFKTPCSTDQLRGEQSAAYNGGDPEIFPPICHRRSEFHLREQNYRVWAGRNTP